MSTVEILAGSVEYVSWSIGLVDASGTAVDPTGDTVEIAIRPVRTTTAWDWHAATWVTAGGVHYARVLIGVSPWVLAAGVYSVAGRVTDSPEVPLLDLGTLYVRAG